MLGNRHVYLINNFSRTLEMFTLRTKRLYRFKNVRTLTDKATLAKIIRVDHAGELGADRIYAGQMAILGTTSKAPLIQHMWEQEKHHKATFEELIRKHRVRPTVMTPIWNIAGFLLGNALCLHMQQLQFTVPYCVY
ncbi:hypothetical protein NQ314_015314 [Rhamnusium bicolor]|uniref:Ubiquinone biosynthesis protein COQ7 n=1 Tax=Rhamnusium bicolor TaxID=1586634 RepID=A0AAV8WZU6_9CUCU|nr:hypothetical protein NQ314_015314 [Rhamnusium bicolor]